MNANDEKSPKSLSTRITVYENTTWFVFAEELQMH
jgi:hypothetical protein